MAKKKKAAGEIPQPITSEDPKKKMSMGFWYFVALNIIMALVAVYKILF
jgi:hypothetical protein